MLRGKSRRGVVGQGLTSRIDKYEVVVGNIGTVYRGNSKKEAAKIYAEYVQQSLAGYGRAANEGVTLFKDGEPTAEHFGEMTDW